MQRVTYVEHSKWVSDAEICTLSLLAYSAKKKAKNELQDIFDTPFDRVYKI